MKILLVGPHPPHGGGSAYSCQELACGLRSLGHDVLQIAPYREPTNLIEYPGLIWMPANCSWESLSIAPEAKSVMDRHLLATYREHGPFDCIILGREFFLWHLPTLRFIHHKPIVLICRGGHINRLAARESATPELREQLIKLYRDCDRIVCIARYLVEVVNQVIGVNKSLFLPNPINFANYHAKSSAALAPEQPIHLLMAAQIKSRKRPLDAVEIVWRLAQEHHDVQLTVCGNGADMERMEHSIRHYGLEKRIHLKGGVARQEVFNCLHQAETVLLCSELEGRPRILQEAIALGKGIVAYDNPGSREVVNEWPAPWPLGRLVPIGDTGAAASSILELARYLRSSPQLMIERQLPKPMEVLYEYELMLKTLQVQPLKVAS